MRTTTFSAPVPVIPAVWPVINNIKPVKRRFPNTQDNPKPIGYYLEPLKDIASNPDRQRILRDFFTENHV